MAVWFHASLELGQHSSKGTGAFDFAQRLRSWGLKGAQASNYLVQTADGGLMTARAVRDAFESRGLLLDGISSHCMWWVHGTAWTQSPTIRPFIPAHLHSESPERITAWTESHLLRLMDLHAELKLLVVPMFWGLYQGWELATGYPWGFWSGPGYDLAQAAKDRFLSSTQRLRDHARKLGLKLAHEIHPNSGAICADDFLALRKLCDDDEVLGVFADPSHCWEGETFEERFTKVGEFNF